jgi:endo-1,3(4)-beta-glucanase
MGVFSNDIFQPIANGGLPPAIGQRGDHPVARLGIQPQQQRPQTNKFYANLFLGSQAAPVFTYPYSVQWSKGGGAIGSWGLAVSHTERSQLAHGPAKAGVDAGDWAFFVNPIGIQSVVLSAVQLTSGTTLTTDSLTASSVNLNLQAPGWSSPTITFPLVQGMAYVTGEYHDATPLLQSAISYRSMTFVGMVPGTSTYKYRVQLADDRSWLIYVSPGNPSYAANKFTLIDAVNIQGPSGFSGTIQIAKLPYGSSGNEETVYDASAGSYASAGSVGASVNGRSGSYSFTWTKKGRATQLLMYALPHHIASLKTSSASTIMSLQLVTTTKGFATAVQGDSWILQEPNLPIDMSFSPWTLSTGPIRSVQWATQQTIQAAGYVELSQDVAAQTNVGSLYYDGKALAKFANIVYTLNDMTSNKALALTGLKLLQQAFNLHVANKMVFPLVYDTAWGGLVSSADYISGTSGQDYGNTLYNDHHFHYGYFVYAAAVIGYLDPSWLNTGSNKAWVNMLIRDYANSIDNDPYTPFSRMFDWFHGHSWASGLIEGWDGRNEESSSEDAMASYAIKVWGQVTGDANMEARGNLMLAIQARSLQSYFLYADDNTVGPTQFTRNKAAGILFDNKIDHTTYFGARPEYIEGIHMLPLMPFSTLTRTRTFVSQEWQTYFASAINQVTGGWKGILMANYAIINPAAAYQFFSNSTGSFSLSFLDDGASQTWYLAWSAALAGY